MLLTHSPWLWDIGKNWCVVSYEKFNLRIFFFSFWVESEVLRFLWSKERTLLVRGLELGIPPQEFHMDSLPELAQGRHKGNGTPIPDEKHHLLSCSLGSCLNMLKWSHPLWETFTFWFRPCQSSKRKFWIKLQEGFGSQVWWDFIYYLNKHFIWINLWVLYKTIA